MWSYTGLPDGGCCHRWIVVRVVGRMTSSLQSERTGDWGRWIRLLVLPSQNTIDWVAPATEIYFVTVLEVGKPKTMVPVGSRALLPTCRKDLLAVVFSQRVHTMGGGEERESSLVPLPFNFMGSWAPLLLSPACMLSHFSRVWLFETLWTGAHQAPLSMGFSRQEYWSGLPCPFPGNLPHPESSPCLLHLLHRQVDSLALAPPRRPFMTSPNLN